MRKAIAVAESVAPAILWVDEIDKAFADYTAAIRLDTTNPWVYSNRGGLWGKGEIDRAISDYTKAIRLDPV